MTKVTKAWALVRNKNCYLPGQIEAIFFDRKDAIDSPLRKPFDLKITPCKIILINKQ